MGLSKGVQISEFDGSPSNTSAEAAARILRKKGYHATLTQGVADAVRLQKGSLYDIPTNDQQDVSHLHAMVKSLAERPSENPLWLVAAPRQCADGPGQRVWPFDAAQDRSETGPSDMLYSDGR